MEPEPLPWNCPGTVSGNRKDRRPPDQCTLASPKQFNSQTDGLKKTIFSLVPENSSSSLGQQEGGNLHLVVLKMEGRGGSGEDEEGAGEGEELQPLGPAQGDLQNRFAASPLMYFLS